MYDKITFAFMYIYIYLIYGIKQEYQMMWFHTDPQGVCQSLHRKQLSLFHIQIKKTKSMEWWNEQWSKRICLFTPKSLSVKNGLITLAVFLSTYHGIVQQTMHLKPETINISIGFRPSFTFTIKSRSTAPLPPSPFSLRGKIGGHMSYHIIHKWFRFYHALSKRTVMKDDWSIVINKYLMSLSV